MEPQECTSAILVDAYHDGELCTSERQRFEAHLADCPACTRDLNSLRAGSARLTAAALPEMPPATRMRLYQAAARNHRRGPQERSVLRIAEWLTAAAAAVLLIGVVGLMRARAVAVTPPAAWEQAAVTLQVDEQAGPGQDPTHLVNWMVSDGAQ